MVTGLEGRALGMDRLLSLRGVGGWGRKLWIKMGVGATVAPVCAGVFACLSSCHTSHGVRTRHGSFYIIV